jgi:hypothetical protein
MNHFVGRVVRKDSLVHSLLLRFSMKNPFNIRTASRASLAIDVDYSLYTLLELFKARYWVDPHSDPNRGRSLEAEIQKRCTHIRERTNGKSSTAAGSNSRFKPYGLIFGVAFLFLSVGPFVAVKFLEALTVIDDIGGDKGSLSAVWALLTLPVTVIVFLIGGMMDAERVVKWFNLAGRQNP